jgi:hypothetical protein
MNTSIENRLNQLPRKVALPFSRLLSTGQLTENVLEDILDAGELSNNQTMLIGFAVGYLHLRAQGVPIHDVIRMAKNQQRPIKLDWSEKRWRQEHDKLARAEALIRLSSENVTYDVSQFEVHLPDQFSGYLIRTSKRLGMEGLRQRHCVASYHSQLQNGSCAIASVFVNRRRWTVQLFTTNDPLKPLSIGQIKTRFNESPSSDIRAEIHSKLDIALDNPVMPRADEPAPAYMDTLQLLLPVLNEFGVQMVYVGFDGSGDDGAIDSAYYIPSETSTIANQTLGDLGDASILATKTVQAVLDDLTYEYLEHTDIDWYNNDGGYGELQIDVRAGTVSMEVNVRYTESICEFHATHNIATGEEID